MKPSLYLKGIEDLERHANKIIKEVNEGRQKILLEQAKLFRDRLREKAPIGPTGNLKRAAYAISYPAKIGSPAFARAGMRPKIAPHAHLVEHGHGGPHPAPPHPFFRPTYDEMMPKINENIARELGKTIEGAV